VPAFLYMFSHYSKQENQTFDKQLKPDKGTYSINQEEFYGFSFVNHGVPEWYIGQQDL